MRYDQCPKDILDNAKTLVESFGPDIYVLEGAIAAALFNERKRCAGICSAEREWGGDLKEALERIESGEEPRIIPGWNAPYDETED